MLKSNWEANFSLIKVNLLASDKRAKQRWTTEESVLHQQLTPTADATPLFIGFLFPAYVAPGIFCVVSALARLVARWSSSASRWSLGWRPKSLRRPAVCSSPKPLLIHHPSHSFAYQQVGYSLTYQQMVVHSSGCLRLQLKLQKKL